METPIYEFGPFRLDARRQILTHAEKRVHVTKKAAQVLKMLVEHAGETVFKEILIEEVWGEGEDKGNYLEQKICELRSEHVFNDDPKDPKFIKTEHGEGYKFIAPVKRVGPIEQGAGHLGSDKEMRPLTAVSKATRALAQFYFYETRMLGRDDIHDNSISKWLPNFDKHNVNYSDS
jgi:DNA-binding winged helix-turn-helix (wHTH) protein